MRRLPAEWEEQDGVLLAWPHENTDWAPQLSRVEPVFARIIAAISRFERVLLLTEKVEHVKEALAREGGLLERITFAPVATNDTWARDFGPITVYDDNRPLHLDFSFNGWGLKFPANLDNVINRRLAGDGFFNGRIVTPPMIFEGGSVESDGKGTLLVTSNCLLEANRNPHLTKDEIDALLCEHLGASHILWLDHGHLVGDDTSSHIDTLARLCPEDTITYVACNDPTDEHFQELSAMKQQLEGLRSLSGQPFRLIPLPFPSPCLDCEGNRLPATYANFLIINGAVLLPVYNDPSDISAIDALQSAFPEHEIIGIDCSSIITQGGSLHCLTMQLPKGAMK
ncbi:MAG: agmatine deiminase family protein [Geobacteraceae bacterium]|nr:agmatine deiminase family protein [Geobacteraceae bacterium]